MKSEYALLGMDTAWQRFDSARGGRKSAFDEKIRALEAAAVGLNLEPEAVHLAAEIAAFEPALEADERIALIVLTLVSLAALQEGSTRFPVVDPISKAPMRRMLDALCADRARRAEKISADGNRVALVKDKAAPPVRMTRR